MMCNHEFRPEFPSGEYCVCGSHKTHHVVDKYIKCPYCGITTRENEIDNCIMKKGE